MSETPEWLNEPALQALLKATQDAGGQARIVGGAVRDFLLGHDGGDVDVASTLLPEATIALAQASGWKAIPTGIAHGTVTLVLPTRIVEVTTLRRDVTTDGRRATVAFTDDWKEDASRRDFTINALSMDAQGVIYDYFDGKKDIAAQTLRFIGDATTRIAEDGLRMLRFFRFLAVFGKPPADATALAAITDSCAMIPALSGERVAQEMKKLLAAHNPAYALRLMQQTGAAPYVFGREIEPSTMIRLQLLEGQADYQCSVWARALALTVPIGETRPDFAPRPQLALRPHPEFSQGKIQTSPEGRGLPASPFGQTGAAALPLPSGEVGARSGATGEGVEVPLWIINRWKLSRHEAQQLTLLANLPAFDIRAPRHFHTRIIRLHGAPVYLDWLLTQAAITTGMDIAPYVHLAHDFKPPLFPITAKDLLAKGMKEGRQIGEALGALEQRWEESDYQLTKEELLQ